MPLDAKIDDRRDNAMRDALLERFRCEIRHIPGLALTADQASRLFDVPPDVCARLLASLVRQGAMQKRPDGRFVVVGVAPGTPRQHS